MQSSAVRLNRCTCFDEIITTIKVLRKNHLNFDDDVAIVLDQTEKWCEIFAIFALTKHYCSDRSCSLRNDDDMLWYVPYQNVLHSFTPQNIPLLVYRRLSLNKPIIGDRNINWEESVCLNLILQQLDFHVTCAIFTKTSPQNLQILRKNFQRVYPSPSRRRMDGKGEKEEMTYPKIYFAIDDFEQAFSDMVVRDGECICVELVARDRLKNRESVIFLGSIRYEVIKQVYESQASVKWQWTNKFINSQRRFEFVRMRGPHEKGYAEMAVARVPNCGFETPTADFEMNYSFGQVNRRLSESNLRNGPHYQKARISSITSPVPCSGSRRWQSEADSVNPYDEVDGNAIDDELSESLLTRIWPMRGFGQAWHWLREKRKMESMPLNGYLTYISLPWSTILDDFLSDRQRRPILTFDVTAPDIKKFPETCS